MEMINFDGSFRMMFEPFHKWKVPLLNEWNYLQYIRADNKDNKYWGPASQILKGQIRNNWIDQFNKRDFSTKRIIKSIRANLFLKWVKHNFPEIPIILLLRHPCPVANSRIRFDWGAHLGDLLSQDELVEDFLYQYKDYILGAETDYEKQIFAWCIENYVPLKQFNPGDILVIFYEDLCLRPENEYLKIMSFLGITLTQHKTDIYKKPSETSTKKSAIKTGGNLIEVWREEISQDQIKKTIEILELFGLDKIYNMGNLPLVRGDQVLEILK